MIASTGLVLDTATKVTWCCRAYSEITLYIDTF